MNKSLKVWFFHDLKDLNNTPFTAVACTIAELHFMVLSYKLFMRGLLLQTLEINASSTFMLQVYYDRLFLPQNWKLPSQFLKYINKKQFSHWNRLIYRATWCIFSFPNKIRNVQLHDKCVCYNKSKHFWFLFFLLNLNEDEFDEWHVFRISGDTFAKYLRSCFQHNWKRHKI